jgi:hypothetical protein
MTLAVAVMLVLCGSVCQYELPPPSEALPNTPMYNCETSVLVRDANAVIDGRAKVIANIAMSRCFI